MLHKAVSDTGAILSFLMLVTAKILLFWQVVAFQNIKIILDMIQGCELRFQFFQGGIIVFFFRLQGIIFSRKLLQRRHLSIYRGIDRLRFFVGFDIFPMLVVEFRRPAGSFMRRPYSSTDVPRERVSSNSESFQ